MPRQSTKRKVPKSSQAVRTRLCAWEIAISSAGGFRRRSWVMNRALNVDPDYKPRLARVREARVSGDSHQRSADGRRVT